MIKYIALIILIYAGVANAQTFQVVTKVAYENERITAYNSLNKVIYQVDCKDFAYQFNSDGSIKIWDDIHAYTLYANTLTVPTFASVVDSLKLWQKRCSIPALNMPSNMDSTHMDTSMVVPFILENIYYNQNKDTSNLYKLNEIYDIIGVINSRGLDSSQVDTSLILPTLISNFSIDNNDTLSAILQEIKAIDVADTSNLWMINEVYNQLGLINARAYDTSQVDTSMIEPFIIESFSIRNNDTLSAILQKINSISIQDTSNYWLLDSIYNELKSVDTFCITGALNVEDSLLHTTVVDCNGSNAVNVKICNTVADTSNYWVQQSISYNTDTAKQILQKLYFETCGISIPSNYIGFDFDLPSEFGTTDATDTYLHIFCTNVNCHYYPPATSSPTTPILIDGNESSINSFIQSKLIADGFTGNELFLVVNGDKTITIWQSPSYTPNGSEFWFGTSTPDNSTNKLYPTTPTTHTVVSGGNNALLVKVCEPLNVVTDLYPITKQILDTLTEQNNILRTLNLGGGTVTNVTPSYTSNRTLLTANTTPAPYSVTIPAGTREITVQNVTGSDIQITTSQGTQILGTRNNITLSNPLNTTISQTVFSGNITISFFSSVLGNISGVAPRVIIDFKVY